MFFPTSKKVWRFQQLGNKYRNIIILSTELLLVRFSLTWRAAERKAYPTNGPVYININHEYQIIYQLSLFMSTCIQLGTLLGHCLGPEEDAWALQQQIRSRRMNSRRRMKDWRNTIHPHIYYELHLILLFSALHLFWIEPNFQNYEPECIRCSSSCRMSWYVNIAQIGVAILALSNELSVLWILEINSPDSCQLVDIKLYCIQCRKINSFRSVENFKIEDSSESTPTLIDQSAENENISAILTCTRP